MSTQMVCSRPLKTMVLGFLGFTVVAASFAFAQRMGYIEASLEKRLMGLLIGMLVIVTGNFLPKTRPLHAPGVNPPGPAAAAERFAGWTLCVVGMAYVALYVFAPLDEARKISAIIGIGAMIYIAASWAWMLRGAVLGGQEQSLAAEQRAAEKRRLMVPLLLAFFYLLATACVVSLLHNRHQIEEAWWWMFLGFWLLYAFVMVVLDRKQSSH